MAPRAQIFRKYDLKDLQYFVSEAQDVASVWRGESWHDCMLYDGDQWSDADYNLAVDAGIDPVTINRIFPTINLIKGMQIVNKYNIIAKGRTQKDSEISQVMSEGIQFVMDQWGGEFLIQQAYGDQIIPGIGYLAVTHSEDPREERIKVAYRDWKEIWIDPYGDPWLDPHQCRYVLFQRWVDLVSLQMRYPGKADELENYVEQTTSDTSLYGNTMGNIWYDEAQQVEELKRVYGYGGGKRNRVRPVEIYYPVYEKGLWAKFADGRTMEVPDIRPDGKNGRDIYAMVAAASEVVSAIVQKMRMTVFLGDIVLDDRYTPYNHDRYPFVPFIGYLDRFGFPYGVGRQLQGQQDEINKRRSMALALLKKRRVIVEEDVVEDKTQLQGLYEEANKPDGFLVVRPNKRKGIEIIEGVTLAPAQMDMLRESEREIQQISGANAELHGIRSDAVSGVALRERENQSATIVASLPENLRRSQKIMGQLIESEIRGQWTGEKVLRITDRMTGADRFVALNERIPDMNTGKVQTKNDITQGIYDIIISEAPPNDTVREQNMNLIIEWVKKSPPQMIPYLMHMAFELSNLPNKDQLLAKIKTLMGVEPGEEDMSPEEIKNKVLKTLEQQKATMQEQAEYDQRLRGLALDKANLENDKLRAEIEKIKGGKVTDLMKAKSQRDKTEIEGFKAGFDAQSRMSDSQAREYERYQNSLNRQEGSGE